MTITEPAMNAQAAHRDRCYANCETVHRLHDKLKALQEKVNVHTHIQQTQPLK